MAVGWRGEAGAELAGEGDVVIKVKATSSNTIGALGIAQVKSV